jgi:PleD family two-component response regulator
LQDAVEKWNAAATIENYTMSISCGFATYHKGVDPAAVLAAADQAMYRSKASAEKTASAETSRAASRAVASGN